MRVLFVTALSAALIAGGCQDEENAERGSPAPRAVQGSLDLPRAEAGAPDAGTRAGHGADRHLLEARGPEAVVRGRVRPASARVEIVDEAGRRRARVSVGADGGFTAVLPGLPRSGVVTFRLTARARAAAPWRTEIVVSRAPGDGAGASSIDVPSRDRTPPAATLLLRSGGSVVSSVAPVIDDDDAPLVVRDPELVLTAITRDEDGGTGRVRASLSYARRCGEGRPVVRRKLHFPPSEIARVRLAPGVQAPVERRRNARVRLAAGRDGCRVRGEAWADATNASGLESFSDQIRFVLAH